MEDWNAWVLAGFGLLSGFVFSFDRDVGFGVLLAFLLGAATLLILSRFEKEQEILFLFWAALAFHGTIVLFLHYTGFQPFTGGDYNLYHDSAQAIAERLSQGTFSLEGIRAPHAYPVIVGVLYALTVPSMVVGQFLNAWLAALSVVLLYFLVREVGASKGWAVIIGLLSIMYPSFVFFGNLLLKEGIVTMLSLATLLLSLRMLKNFSWWQVPFLFLLVTLLVHFRIYIGMIFIGVFLVSWFLFSSENSLRRALLGFVLFLLLGFAPLLNGFNYYGTAFIIRFFDPNVVRFYKEEAFGLEQGVVAESPESPVSLQNVTTESPEGPVFLQNVTTESPESPVSLKEVPISTSLRSEASVPYLTTGFESPVAFLWNYTRSFALAALGPFPWHLKTSTQYVALLEVLPWLAIAVFIGKGILEQVRKNWHSPSLLLVLFALAVFAVLAFYFNNFGILMRIRVPAVLALLPFFFLAFHSYPEAVSLMSRIKTAVKPV